MASAITRFNNNDCETCVLCSSKHNRTRPSFCQCKHCSIPLCLDCMKEHHEELLQDVAQISHQYNELQQLLQIKQMMIVEETAKSIESVNQYFDIHIAELCDTKQKIIADMEKTKQDAQDHVRKIDADLRTLGGEIQGLAKESIVQTTKTKHISAELNKIEQQLSTYQATRTENLTNTKPDFSIKFDCSYAEIETPHSTIMETNDIFQPSHHKPLFQINPFNTLFQSPVTPKDPIKQPRKTDAKKGERNVCSMSDDDDDTDSDDNHIETCYNIDRMASDGKNVLYTSYYDGRSDLIAYCLMDNDDDDDDDNDDDNDDDGNDDDEECENWNQSRIVDMIWWGGIKKFICATKDGIYTVDYADKKFEIKGVICGKWSFIRVAANTTQLFIWIKSIENDFRSIEVYSTKFEQIRKIDFDKSRTKSFLNETVSFCVTNNVIASIYTRKKNDSETLKVTFCDMNMNKLNSIHLDECIGYIEIRTDGKNLFFITTGLHKFYIISVHGIKQTINLQHYGKCIGVLDDKSLAVSNGISDIELIDY